jgi:predicted membrane protein DUF2306
VMACALVLGFVTVRRREFAAHRAWMMRAYAIGQGAGSQAVLFGIWMAAAGEPDVTTRALIMGTAWTLNLAVAEFIIRRKGK